MRTGNLTDMNGFSLQRIKVITEIPTVTSSNNGQIYCYVGEENLQGDIWIGDIMVVEDGKMVVTNRSFLHSIEGTGVIFVDIQQSGGDYVDKYWTLNNGDTWHRSGDRVFIVAGDCVIKFSSLQGFQKPNDIIVDIISGEYKELNATYSPINGGDNSSSSSELTSTIAGYRVAGAGTTAANGDYLPAGEYGGRTMYQYGSYYLRFNGSESNPGWQIFDGSNILYFGSGATPETIAWYTTSYPPVPTVTVIEGTGNGGDSEDDSSSSDSTKPSYYTTNTPGTAAAGGVYVWDESLGVWSNGTYYMKNTGLGYYWIYHKDTIPGASTGAYCWIDLNATGNETPDTVTFVSNPAINSAYSGIDPAPVFAVYSEE